MKSFEAQSETLCILKYTPWWENKCTFCTKPCDETNFKLNPYAIQILMNNSLASEEHQRGDGLTIIFAHEENENCLDQYICERCCIENENPGWSSIIFSNKFLGINNSKILFVYYI